ncbi:conjugative transposon protein TraM [Chitinophaga pollutisoli]|uniref:Conjugative transposon protein TraM n=1 Tax=Chitinophaga pollutisoli TaxID=3133966 RepID=A0ABZ2YRU1_9BACT
MSLSNKTRKKVARAILPLLLVPFAALIYYVVGDVSSGTEEPPSPKGLNVQLPSPNQQDKGLDKLDTYRKAAADSAKRRDQESSTMMDYFSMRREQPETDQTQLPTGAVESPFSPNHPSYGSVNSRTGYATGRNEKQLSVLENKLQHIQQTIDRGPEPPPPSYTMPASPDPALAQLESQMDALQRGISGDNELNQMGGMLKDILDIQHPERVRERIRQQSAAKSGAAFPVTSIPRSATSAYFGGVTSPADTGKPKMVGAQPSKSVFYDNTAGNDTLFNQYLAIQAAIHEQQSLVSGATVKIRLLQSVYVDGRLIPEGTFIFGSCQLTGERLGIEVTSIRTGTALFPVKLTVYDLDGNAGIRIPGSINRDASKESADQAIQSAAFGTLDPSIGAQAASAGIETARKMLSRKIKLVRVTLSADYPILLYNKQ